MPEKLVMMEVPIIWQENDGELTKEQELLKEHGIDILNNETSSDSYVENGLIVLNNITFINQNTTHSGKEICVIRFTDGTCIHVDWTYKTLKTKIERNLNNGKTIQKTKNFPARSKLD